MAEYEFHPLCLEYELLSETEFEEMKRSIAENGLEHAITLYEGVILDGRNRYLACQAVGVDPHFEVYEGNDPRGLVKIKNDDRRHESAWVKASRAAKKVNSPAHRPAESCSPEHVTWDDAARSAGVSKVSVRRAGNIQKNGIPALLEAVDAGEITMLDGDAIARLAPEKQSKAIERALAPKPIRTDTTGVDEWYTPKRYIELAREVMEGIDLDPASCEQGQQNVQAKRFFTQEDDGLAQSWEGRVWMNPPYSKGLIDKFVTKLVEEHTIAGTVTEAIVLTHNFTDTGWFRKMWDAATCVCFTYGRVKFESPTGVGNSPTSGHVFFYFGPNPDVFLAVFDEIGNNTKII